MAKKYKVYGPVQDGFFTCWQVIGPRGGFVAEFLTRKAALEFITRCKKHSKFTFKATKKIKRTKVNLTLV